MGHFKDTVRATLGAGRLAIAILSGLGGLVAVTPAAAQTAQTTDAVPSNPVVVDDNGTVHVPPLTVPPSSLLSDKSKGYLADYLLGIKDPATRKLPDGGVPPFMRPYIASAWKQFAVVRKPVVIAGVKGFSYTPKAGIKPANQHRILLNLHGGGFGGCYPGCAELESMPIAALRRTESRVARTAYPNGERPMRDSSRIAPPHRQRVNR